ncbi:MAG: hypothetical protein HQ483_05970 [Rhodospirillales bacterium]|nr:hypothetical protein [Rhodospirillales bacterium]
MKKNNVLEFAGRDTISDPLTDLLRSGAQQLISQAVEAALPWLYLKGVSSGEMGEALSVLIGPDAKGLSASTVSRLKQVWG